MGAGDKFIKVGNPGSATTLAAPGYTIGDGTITVVSTTNWPAGPAGCVFAIDIIGADGRRIDGTYNVYQGTVATATSITNVSHISGTGTNRNYPAGTTTRVYIIVASEIQNRLVDGLIVEHDQDGTHGAVTAASVNVAGTVTTDTIAEKTAAAGVTIDGLQIKDNYVVGAAGKGVKNTSLDTTAGELGGAWISWTPTWTLTTTTSSTTVAKYIQVGKTVYFRLKFTFGASTAFTGSFPTFSLPVTAKNDTTSAGMYTALFNDNTIANYIFAGQIGTGASSIALEASLASGTYVTSIGVSSTVPFTWGTNDNVNVEGFYEVA